MTHPRSKAVSDRRVLQSTIAESHRSCREHAGARRQTLRERRSFKVKP